MYFIGLKCDRFEINLPLSATVHATAFAKSIDSGAKGHDALCVAKLTASLSFCVSMSFFSACRLSMPSLLALQVNSHFPVYTTLLFILLSLAFLSCYWLTGCSIIFLNLSQRFQLEYIFHIYKTFHWRISFCSLCFFICFILLPLFFCCASSWVPSVMSFAFVRRALLYIQFIWLERLNPKAAHNIKLNYIFSFASLFLSFIAAFSSFLLFFDFIIFSVKNERCNFDTAFHISFQKFVKFFVKTFLLLSVLCFQQSRRSLRHPANVNYIVIACWVCYNQRYVKQ